MNEYEKMMAGGLYDANDPQLIRMRFKARSLLDKLNKSAHDIKSGERLRICKKIFGKVGKGFVS